MADVGVSLNRHQRDASFEKCSSPLEDGPMARDALFEQSRGVEQERRLDDPRCVQAVRLLSRAIAARLREFS
jgi:hypothetical protein